MTSEVVAGLRGRLTKNRKALRDNVFGILGDALNEQGAILDALLTAVEGAPVERPAIPHCEKCYVRYAFRKPSGEYAKLCATCGIEALNQFCKEEDAPAAPDSPPSPGDPRWMFADQAKKHDAGNGSWIKYKDGTVALLGEGHVLYTSFNQYIPRGKSVQGERSEDLHDRNIAYLLAEQEKKFGASVIELMNKLEEKRFEDLEELANAAKALAFERVSPPAFNEHISKAIARLKEGGA